MPDGVRVYGRLCPAPPSHPSPFTGDGSTLTCEDSIPCTFSAPPFGASVSNAAVFEATATRILDVALRGAYPRGGFGAIVAYGESQSGRTHTIFGNAGDAGVVQRSLKYLFDNGATKLTIQMCQLPGDTCQDLLSDADNVRVSVDDRFGAQAELREEVCTAAEKGAEVVARGWRRRESRAGDVRSHSAAAHAVVLVGVQTAAAERSGRVVFVDAAACDRPSEHPVNPAVPYADSVRCQQTVGVFEECAAGVAQGRDHRALPFKTSKLTRFLQHPLAYAGAGQGVAAIVVCLRADGLPDRRARSLTFGARCLPDASASIGALKDKTLVAERLFEQSEGREAEKSGQVDAARHSYAALTAQCRHKEQELQVVAGSLERQKQALRKTVARDHSKGERSRNEALRTSAAQSRRELDAAKELVLGTPGATERAIAALNEQADTEIREHRRRTDRAVAAERVAADDLAFNMQQQKRRADKLRVWGERVEAELKQLAEEEQALAGKLAKATGPSRSEGMTPEQLRRARGRFALLDEVDELEEAVERLTGRVRELRAEAEVDAPTDSDDGSSSGSVHVLRGLLLESDDDCSVTPPSSPRDGSSSLPPSAASSPRPMVSFAEDPPEAAESSDDSSSTFSSDTSTSTRSATESEKQAKQVREEFEAVDKERRQLAFTVSRELRMHNIVKDIMKYLDHGTPVTMVVNNADKPPWLVNALMYLARDRTLICICQAEKAKPLDRKKITEVVELQQIKAICLGQSSEEFRNARQRTRTAEQAHDPTQPMPPTTGDLHHRPGQLGSFFYRSVSLELGGRKRRSLDFVTNTDQDHEAWVVALLQLTKLNPQWGQGLVDIARNKGYNQLEEEERKFCVANHISPLNFLNAKRQVLARPRLMINLYDMRTISSLDMQHSQKLFEFFSKQGYIERTVLWPVIYGERGREHTRATREFTGKLSSKASAKSMKSLKSGMSAPAAAAPAAAAAD
eukprot:TRINITY_DN6519_c4_g1_i1.p1 TRINITY_DN6519_c4_g1~~TRINITY_DN6519_c4_g1_i1.p1  ORF type:complete len:1023 (+),score=251.87 TRINITY_DN6519_c4_g1_i1:154-3069(+)